MSEATLFARNHNAPPDVNDSHDLPVLELSMTGIADAYDKYRLIPTSTNADILLIRWHIAYHCGGKEANRVRVAPSRGHSYRVKGLFDTDYIVTISNHFDHRHGVVGIL
jgi:hypothetical protein